ncbi:hypothetical protein ACIQBJ_15320 [Kitasatospora sp. NPDC088391]|uniref:hypothetical protein n=1 Tax=Kitasatospora sp. NPDC088391 TaxID=3364074 RepID=UPI00381A33CC
MTGSVDAGAPVLEPCPSCGSSDRVVGVPAVYHRGRDQVTVTGLPRSDDNPSGTETRRFTSSLSDALRPAPVLLPLSCAGHVGLGVLLVLVSIGTFVGGAVGGGWFADDPGPDRSWAYDAYHSSLSTGPAHRPDLSFLGWISAIALLAAVTLFVRARRERAAQRRLLAGRPEAERVWARGWYCERCGSVHFRSPTGAAGRAMTLQEFRAEVWDAGGYGQLAERGRF